MSEIEDRAALVSRLRRVEGSSDLEGWPEARKAINEAAAALVGKTETLGEEIATIIRDLIRENEKLKLVSAPTANPHWAENNELRQKMETAKDIYMAGVDPASGQFADPNVTLDAIWMALNPRPTISTEGTR